MKIEILSSTGSVQKEYTEDHILSYEIGGIKLMSDDFFMNEPGYVDITMLRDLWLMAELEENVMQVGKSMWHKGMVRIHHKLLGTHEVQYLTGLICATECSEEPFTDTMRIKVYDPTALLGELEIPVRIYYPRGDNGTDFERFLIHYRLPDDSGEGLGGELALPWMHSVTTSDRQISTVLSTLGNIYTQAFATLYAVDFYHDYLADDIGLITVNNSIVPLSGEDSFYIAFVLGMVYLAYSSMADLAGISYYEFWANYGLMPTSARASIYQEYTILPPLDYDCYFVMRSGYQWSVGGKDISNPGGGWHDGDDGGGVDLWHKEWYRIFGLKDGAMVWDSGMHSRIKHSGNTGTNVGSWQLSPITEIDNSGHLYRATQNDFYSIPTAYQNHVMDYFYAQTYYVYYTGQMDANNNMGKRIFRMKIKPGENPAEYYQEQSLKDWLKTMYFLGDLSCYADSSGIIRIVPRFAGDAISLPLEMLTNFRKKRIIYQPWDKEKLSELINDSAEIAYLIDYYGGDNAISEEVELEFALSGITTIPSLRDKIELDASILNVAAFSQSGAYTIVEIKYTADFKLVLRVIKE